MKSIAPDPEFPGFPDFRANVTFVPLQFFTAVLPYRSRGCVRLVGFMIRRLLGWVDAEGNPTCEQLRFRYRTLITEAGISRGSLADAIVEALQYRLIRQVTEPDTGDDAIYALSWSDHYTDSPHDFAGFFRREAVAFPDDVDQPKAPVAKAARKNIPNAFFDYVLRRERLSVVQVVAVMLFKSIQWGPGGERKAPVSISITELSRLAKLSRHHVHAALHHALARGYVERVQEGYFDPRAGTQSFAATYRIRWTSQPVNPVYSTPKPQAVPATAAKCPFTILNQSKMVNGAGEQNGERKASNKVNGNQHKKVNDISIKRSIKNNTTAAKEVRKPVAAAAAAEGVIAKLVNVGFDASAAESLARRHSVDVIERQLAWLPLRKADQNRLGLLRSSIEGNWTQPERSAIPPAHAAGALFVRHFESALHGYAEPPSSCTAKEAERAARFLRELTRNTAVDAESQAAEWGRRFGQFVRAKSPQKPWFNWVERMYGAEFLRNCRQTNHRDAKTSTVELRRAHEKQFSPQYESYLREVEARVQREQPALYAAFEEHRRETVTRFELSEKTRSVLASETCRLSALADFLRERGARVAEFWEWDRRFNPQSWKGHWPSDPASPAGAIARG